MKPGKGRLIAHLADRNEQLPADIIELINSNIKPLERISDDDVYVRAMYVVSDQVNSFGGRFPVSEHEHLVSLLIDSPVLVGHRKDRLPIARTFHAETTERDGQAWVKSYFYWPKKADDALQLKENIDSGIIKECSISFTFHLPECSVCGRDIRLCQHQPLEKVSGIDEELICHFNYRKIEKVLETSLVFRGAVPGTGLTKELENSTGDNIMPELEVINDLTSLNDKRQYLIVPHYQGISVQVRILNEKMLLSRLNGSLISSDLCAQVDTSCLKSISTQMNRPALLVGYQGRKRCSLAELEQFISDSSGPVSRLFLYLYPLDALTKEESDIGNSGQGNFVLRLMPHRVSLRAMIDSNGRGIMTRDGVEIWPIPIGQSLSKGFLYHPCLPKEKVTKQSVISFDRSCGVACIQLHKGEPNSKLVIHGYDHEQLQKGRSFIVDMKHNLMNSDKLCQLNDGIKMTRHGQGYHLEINDEEEKLSQIFLLRAIRFKGKNRFLISRYHANQAIKNEQTQSVTQNYY